MNKLIQNGKIVSLNDVKKAKVIGRLASGEYIFASGEYIFASGEYIFASGKGGQISYFKADAVAKEDKQ